MTTPTPHEIKTAKLRAEVAARQRAQYDEALALAEAAFGVGWVPVGRHLLVDHDEEERARKCGEPMRAATTVYTAAREGVKRHFVVEEGKPREVAGYEEGFGEMLTEPDPVRGFEKDGVFHHVHRYALHWAGYENNYQPKSAEALAAARLKREARAVEKEAKENPLFASEIRREGYVPRKRGR